MASDWEMGEPLVVAGRWTRLYFGFLDAISVLNS